MTGMLDKLKQWFGHSEDVVKQDAHGEEPVATPPAGTGDEAGETSSNAQSSGASGEPWPGNS